MKPGAYVARAYREARENSGRPPDWARKLANGRWEFDARYVHDDAERNVSIIGISEAARLLGTSRPTIQAWVDRGIVASTETTDRTKGDSRSILRKPFMLALPSLKERLKKPAAKGRRRNARKPASAASAERAGTRLSGRLDAAKPRPPEHESVLVAARNAKADVERDLREAERRAKQCGELVRKRNTGLESARKARREAASALAKALRAARQNRARVKKSEEELARLRVKLENDRRTAAAAAAAAAMTRAEKARRAAAIEAELRAAMEQKRREALWEEQASTIATRLVDDMFDDRLDRIRAMALFNQNATAAGIPDEVRIRVRKNFFGR